MDESLFAGLARPLAELCSDAILRRIEAGASVDPGSSAGTFTPAQQLWRAIDALGYTDALVATRYDGAGLTLAEAFPLFFLTGQAGLNFPLGETAMARALLRAAGYRPGTGCIAIASAHADGDALACGNVPGAGLASHVLVDWQDDWLLLPLSSATRSAGHYRAHASAVVSWPSAAAAVFRCARPGADAETICNAVHAAEMAGAMARVQQLSVAYANDRQQFGKSISRFQAIQQELAVLAEHAAAAYMAAQLGCCSSGIGPAPLRAASAKLRASEAAGKVAAIAHAVHGAIGITEEHNLGLLTRRLHEWRATPGTEARCAMKLGLALLETPTPSLFDFVRSHLGPDTATTAATAA